MNPSTRLRLIPSDAEPVLLTAADGYGLIGLRHDPPGPTRARLIVAGATGVPQRFYGRFARFAASRGYSTLTFDYRGMGLSAPPTLRGFRMEPVPAGTAGCRRSSGSGCWRCGTSWGHC